MLIGAIYGFLEPGFGANDESFTVFASLLLGLGGVTYIYGGGQALFTRRRLSAPAGIRVFPAALLIAGASVLVTRLTDFEPGVVYGFVAAFAVLVPVAFDTRQQGQLILIPGLVLLAAAMAAWVLVVPLRNLAEDDPNLGLALLEAGMAIFFVASLEGLFFNMVPLRFMDGDKLRTWSVWVWLFMFTLATFLFWHVLLNSEKAYDDALQEPVTQMALIMLGVFCALTLGVWAYFRFRPEGALGERAAAVPDDPGGGLGSEPSPEPGSTNVP